MSAIGATGWHWKSVVTFVQQMSRSTAGVVSTVGIVSVPVDV
jgi:hypothetical protein